MKQIKHRLFREEDIRVVVGDCFSRVRAEVLAIPSANAVLITGKQDPLEVKQILDVSIQDTLRELSDYTVESFAARNPLSLPVDLLEEETDSEPDEGD